MKAEGTITKRKMKYSLEMAQNTVSRELVQGDIFTSAFTHGKMDLCGNIASRGK